MKKSVLVFYENDSWDAAFGALLLWIAHLESPETSIAFQPCGGPIFLDLNEMETRLTGCDTVWFLGCVGPSIVIIDTSFEGSFLGWCCSLVKESVRVVGVSGGETTALTQVDLQSKKLSYMLSARHSICMQLLEGGIRPALKGLSGGFVALLRHIEEDALRRGGATSFRTKRVLHGLGLMGLSCDFSHSDSMLLRFDALLHLTVEGILEYASAYHCAAKRTAENWGRFTANSYATRRELYPPLSLKYH